MAAVQQLSGTIVVIIIAVGVQACIILFIFAKRQIQRFALRNRRGPHMSIGHGGPKALRREADKFLDYVQYIKHEPLLEPLDNGSSDYRRLIIIHFQSFEYELASYSQHFIRPPCGNVRSHMISCIHGPLVGVETRLVHQICDDYNSARHHYEEIDAAKYQAFLERLNSLKSSLRANKLAKPNASPLPPTQSFSDSPRKRRGRGNTNISGIGIGSNSGTFNRRGENPNKRQNVQTIVSGTHSDNVDPTINLASVQITHDNSSFVSPDNNSSIPVKQVVNKEDGDAGSQKLSSGNISNAPSTTLSSVVTVDTKNFNKTGGINNKLAAV